MCDCKYQLSTRNAMTWNKNLYIPLMVILPAAFIGVNLLVFMSVFYLYIPHCAAELQLFPDLRAKKRHPSEVAFTDFREKWHDEVMAASSNPAVTSGAQTWSHCGSVKPCRSRRRGGLRKWVHPAEDLPQNVHAVLDFITVTGVLSLWNRCAYYKSQWLASSIMVRYCHLLL